MNYIPLHIHTGYTFKGSSLKIEDLMSISKNKNFSSMGICDLNNAYAYPSFYHACKKNNITPLLGISLNIKVDERDFYICLYIKNETGYKNICLLQGLESIDIKTLVKYSNGLVLVVPTISNAYVKELFLNKDKRISSLLFSLKGEFIEVYLGIEVYSKSDQELVSSIRDYASRHSYETICFPKHLYENKNDALVIEILKAINDKTKLEDSKELLGPYCFLNENAVNALYLPNEIENTHKIFEGLDFELIKVRGSLLSFPIEGNKKEYIYNRCITRLNDLKINDERYISRLNEELNIIEKMGYLDYFLIVQDYVKFAKDNDIPVGPGRGSAAGSLVSYLLNIIDIDPLTYGLYFERFLNPQRVTLPDIDVDFAEYRRDEVIDYICSKYGKKQTAYIVTFQTIGAKQAIRDIGNVFSINEQDINNMCKAIKGHDVTLLEERKNNPNFDNLCKDKYFENIFNLALLIEGLPRQDGLHAAGVIINNEPLDTIIPTKINDEGKHVIQFEKDYIEEQGLYKMDILAVRNLSIIEEMENRIKESKLDYNFNLNDQKTFSLLSKGFNKGIFQLESDGMKKTMMQVKINSFDDIVAILALYRPGPMEFIPDYANNKNNNVKINYIHPDLEEILKPTYGIIVYQEQIMRIVQKVASFSLGEADLFRRAISKKDESKLLSLKDSFIEGAKKNNYSIEDATKIYDLIYKFADYGFNKSHSVAYALISYKMAFIKANYPDIFYATSLDYLSLNDEKISTYNKEMKFFNIKISLPSINTSTLKYQITNKGLIIPFSGIKGLPRNVCEDLIHERDIEGPFKDILDLITRMKDYSLTYAHYEKLVDAGALDEFNLNRNTLHHHIKVSSEFINNMDMKLSSEEMKLVMPALYEYNEDEQTKYTKELEALGVLLSGSLFYKYKLSLQNKKYVPIVDLVVSNNKYVPVIGIVKQIREYATKNKELMATISISDDTSSIKVTLFPRVYALVRPIIQKQNALFIEGQVQIDSRNENELVLLANNVTKLEEDK